MTLELTNKISRNEYLSNKDFYTLKGKVYDYLVNAQGKTEEVADNYVNYSYKAYDCIKFVSMILIELDNQPYFIGEAFYGEDGETIYFLGEYAKNSYAFELK